MKRALVALIVGLIGLTACGSAHSLGTAPSSPSVQTSPSDPPASSSPTPKPKPKPTASTPSPKPPQSTGTAACSSSQGGKQVSAQLVDVRVGRHDTYDRVTFEFSGGIPSYRIRTDANPTEDGSGLPLNLRGSTYAVIVFQDSSGFDLDGNQTYKGPSDFRPGFPVLAEVKAAGDFERVLRWAFGLDHSKCWHVLELSNPARVVVDFPH